MANQVTSLGTMTVELNTFRYITNLSFINPITGSNVIAVIQTINTGSYQSLDSSSLSDIRYFIASNQDETGSVSISMDGSGTKILSYLQPGDFMIISNTGSFSGLYAKAMTKEIALQYMITEA